MDEGVRTGGVKTTNPLRHRRPFKHSHFRHFHASLRLPGAHQAVTTVLGTGSSDLGRGDLTVLLLPTVQYGCVQ